MAAYRPLVVVGGTMRQLADGDTLSGFPRFLPFALADGSSSRIALTTTATGVELPFTLASGAASNIVMEV